MESPTRELNRVREPEKRSPKEVSGGVHLNVENKNDTQGAMPDVKWEGNAEGGTSTRKISRGLREAHFEERRQNEGNKLDTERAREKKHKQDIGAESRM